MQANKLFMMNSQIQKRFFFSTSWKNRRLGHTVEEVLRLKGPRCLKPHRIMWKFVNKAKNGVFSRPPVGAPSISLEKAVISTSCRSIPVSKRSMILNKMFMKNITEILSTSEVGLPLLGHNIQFSRVRVNVDYSVVNVYWIPQGTDNDEEIQYLLNCAANPLRQELISLRVMGLVPRISFVKDKYHALLAEVDRRLKIADFGDYHIPAFNEGDHLREDLQLFTTLPKELKQKIADLEAIKSFDEDEEQDLPDMRMDVFSLNYNKILRNVKQGILKSKTQKEQLDDVLSNSRAVFELPSTAILNKETWDKASFKKYIKQRNIKMKKAQQMSSREYREIHTAYLEQLDERDLESTLYDEFVKYNFEDEIEDFHESEDERNEIEQ